MKQYVIILTEAQIDAIRNMGAIDPDDVLASILSQADALDAADSDYRLNLEKED